jgi:4-hydroxy-tetrahydrodipicolinate synthase
MFQGSIVAIVTPMHDDGSVDDAALARLIEFHIESGTDGIVSMGTTGESATLNHDEHMAVVRKTIALVNGRVPVIAGTGANSTSEALELTAAAKAAKADACLLVTPYYNKPTQEGLVQHFTKIADGVDIPQLLYNVPGRTACDMLPETVARVANHPNIVGIKEASGKLERVTEIIGLCPSDFVVVSGEDPIACDTILAGGKGVISVTANVAPAPMHQMCMAALAGDAARAKALDACLQPLHANLFLESNPIPAKWALCDMGLISAGIRLPLTPLSEQYYSAVREAIRISQTALDTAA